jgi:hypothetical protein
MIALRLGFALCLGLIVVLRPEVKRNELAALEDADISARISAVLAQQGVPSWPQEVPYKDSLRAQVVEFQPEACDSVAKIIPFSITLSSKAYLAMNNVHEWPIEMAHLDARMPHLSRARLVWGAVQAMLRDTVGQTPTQNGRSALIIAAPPGCPSAFNVDLRTVWEGEA